MNDDKFALAVPLSGVKDAFRVMDENTASVAEDIDVEMNSGTYDDRLRTVRVMRMLCTLGCFVRCPRMA